MVRKLLTSGTKPRLIAQTMKRSIGAVQSRIYLFKKPPETASAETFLICRFDNSPLEAAARFVHSPKGK
jgi:hypothetical protein